MKILHLINRPQMRGAEMFAVRVASQLQREGVDNAICSLYTSEGKNDYFNTGNLATYELGVKPTFMDRIFRIDPIVILRLRRVLKDYDPDVIVGHGADTLKYTSIAGRLRKNVKTVYKNIGTASYWANTRGRVLFNRFWLRNIDYSISVSEHTRTDFTDHYSFDASRAIYIQNAIKVESFDAASDPAIRKGLRTELGVSDEDVVVGMVGSMSRGKGQDTLIQATAKLREEGLPVVLVLVGTGPELENLEGLAEEYEVSSSIRFLGLREDIPQVLRAFDIFALASVSEGMPGVLIEAGLSKLPSVSFDVGGVREVLKHDVTGLVISDTDESEFTRNLRELVIHGDLRNRIGEQAELWCRARFDLNLVANQYKQLFEYLVHGYERGGQNPNFVSNETHE